ncbi:permease [Limibaculum sp. FT325]|uniref:permease n=1 Tax=Thermohalobaculum sediminis TaxID=2939436 RepID=UPI0020C0E7EE|nr:permease [Limibaculum sediminis]MCL5777546.1 permease [Limibaculum sediminis]
MTALAAQLRRLLPSGLRLDRVWAAILAILAALALVDPVQAQASAVFALEALASTAPYLVASIAIAAYAGATGADALVAKAFSGRIAGMVVLAALFGGLSPFCSCGVIPLIAALMAMGVPLAPVMAFWLASPVIDPAQFVLTAGTIGTEFAVAKTLAAVGLGLFGGFGTLWLSRAGFLADPLRPGVGNGGCGGAKMRNPKPPVWAFWHEPARVAKFRAEALKATLFLTKWLMLAFLLESLMLVWLPAETVAAAVGGEGVLPIVIATLVGVPAYLNGYAALPLVSGLMTQGMAPGAGLAFLVAGGVSSLPAAIAVFALVKRPVFALYLGFALSGSLMAGLIFQAVQ